MSELIVQSPRCGLPASLRPTALSMLRTLDISVRVLFANVRGGADRHFTQQLLTGWSHDIFRYASATLTASGREHLVVGKPYVVMSNHGSMMDIPALIATYPSPLRMVTKESLLRIPIWGRALVDSGFIPISRGNTPRAIEQLEVAKRRLAEGIAVWIAPEGTRSRDRLLGPFKKGGFYLARQLEAEIVPAYVHGANDVLSTHGVKLTYDVDVSVHYGAPIPMDPGGDLEAQMATVRAAVLDLSAGRLRSRPARADPEPPAC